MTNRIPLIGGLVAIAVIAAMLSMFSATVRTAQASPLANSIGAATTTASFAVTTSTRILATTTNTVGTGHTRVYASICNPNANPVVLLLNNDKAANLATGNITTVIAAAAGYNVCYEITDRNQYQGSITASSTNQTSTTITVADYVQ